MDTQLNHHAPDVTVSHLSVSYDAGRVVDDVSFTLPHAALTAIIGPNGAGKSTLIKAILDLVHTEEGTVTLLGEPPKVSRKRVAYIPQRSDIDWHFPITVLEVVLLGTYPRLKLFRRPGKRERAFARECLAHVGMEAYEHRQIGELSGGQQQRVFIARALAQQPDLFVLDEPFAGIDAASGAAIMSVLRSEQQRGRGAIVVHHHLASVRENFTHAVLINRKLVHAGPITEVFTEAHLTQAFAANLRVFETIQEMSA